MLHFLTETYLFKGNSCNVTAITLDTKGVSSIIEYFVTKSIQNCVNQYSSLVGSITTHLQYITH